MNYGLVITVKDNAFVGKSIPPQVAGNNNGETVLAKQCLCLADLVVDGFANTPSLKPFEAKDPSKAQGT